MTAERTTLAAPVPTIDRMPIRPLPSLLVNQIAAGEVIERPASVVKELMENAIDAGSTRIDVEIEAGGRERIAVIDNGCGIPMDELPLALAAHATSKIAEAEDLDAIATMGFRGEALASIASVARMSITSRPHDADSGAIIEAEGDTISAVRPQGSASGTTMVVRNLFFNTPARRKFLKTDQTETGRIRTTFQSIAMAHPSVAFCLRIDGRISIDLPPDQSARPRLLSLLGKEYEAELLEFQNEDRGLRFWGLAGHPSVARSTARAMQVFLNGRPLNDRTINHAVKEAYRGLIEPGQYPTVVLFIEIDPSEVDVNVHPAKAEVRFRHQSVVHSAVRRAVLAPLKDADLVPDFDLGRIESSAAPTVFTSPTLPVSEPLSKDAVAESGNTFVEYFRQLAPNQKGFVYTEVKQALEREAPDILHQLEPQADTTTSDAPPHETPATLGRVRQDVSVLQVHSSFLVTQDEEGLVIIDQPALHERVMFEKLKARIIDGPLESQRLLTPATFDADAPSIEALHELGGMFERLGIEAEPIGPNAVAVHAFPSLLFERRVEPIAFMKELLQRQVNDGLNTDPEAAIHEVLDMMSCKAAVKAGDRMTDAELQELLEAREAFERTSNCPHGRPTTLRITIKDLERQFGRL